jgi:acetyl esterase/lipase
MLQRRITMALLAAVTLAGPLAPAPLQAAISLPNIGLPGSPCVPIDAALFSTPPGPGVSTSGLGPGAPAYYEIGLPTGAYAGLRPKAVMLTIHGGAWFMVGPAAAATERPEADRWRAAGWLTVNISYRGCGDSIADVSWFYHRVREIEGPGYEICATGSSAGAHLAMVLAATFPDLGCAIGQGVLTDLAGLTTETAHDPLDDLFDQALGPTLAQGWAGAAFGADPVSLGVASPILHAVDVRARLLLADAHDDMAVPFRQATDLAAAVEAAHPGAYVDTDQLDSGFASFTHAFVSQAALDDYRARENALVAPLLPVPAINSPPANFIPRGGSLTGRASDTSAAIDSVAVTFTPVFGGPPAVRPTICSSCGTSSVTWSVGTSGLAAGFYDVSAAATSATGNVGYSGSPGIRLLIG